MSNPFVKHDEAAPIADVNVVPLADVSLVLLIILLVLSPMAAQSMLKVQTAAAKADDMPKGPKPGEDPLVPRPPEPVIAVGLSPSGYILEGRLLATDADLRAWLVPELARHDDKKVFLAPELDIPNGRVVSAIETLQNCGASTVALVQVADPTSGTAP
ncbi:MAG: biopolymer transporter ExbD [Elusimicrobia bacterium]|nr:biopolymer transporter ExbD [Elusimicrobiota bacterium]